jgi:NAD+ synthase (glutamine-hydrolysing)
VAAGPPATDLALAGAELLVNVSASPFHVGREVEREEMFVTRARDNACFVAFCNAVGGQDELIFDGHSCVLDDEGEVVARAPASRRLARRRRRAAGVIGRRLRDVGAALAASARSAAGHVVHSDRATRIAPTASAVAPVRADSSRCARARARAADYVKERLPDVVSGCRAGSTRP